MAKLSRPQWESRVRFVQNALRNGDLAAAKEAVDTLASSLASLGRSSTHVVWLRAVVADGLDQHFEAVTLIEEAGRLDPASPQAWNSRRIIFDRARAAIQGAVEGEDGSGLLPLYDLLVRADEADLDTHAAAAAISEKAGLAARAVHIQRGVALLYLEANDNAVLARQAGEPN